MVCTDLPDSWWLSALPLLCSLGPFSVIPTVDSILHGAQQDPGLGRKVELSAKRELRVAGASGLHGQAQPLQTCRGCWQRPPFSFREGDPTCLCVVDQLSRLMRAYFISCEVLCKTEVWTRQDARQCSLCCLLK